MSSIGELVLEDQNGCLFDNAAQLEDLLVDLLENFPESKKLHRFRMDLAANFQNYTWNDNWQQTALPIFQNWIYSKYKGKCEYRGHMVENLKINQF